MPYHFHRLLLVPTMVLVSAMLLAGEPPAPGTVVGLNVKDFGAMGDGKADDTAALQKAIDAAAFPAQHNRNPLAVVHGLVILPPGHYRLTAPLRLEPRHGRLVLRGTGGVDTFGGSPGDKRMPRAVTQLLYDGEAGGTLVDVSGVGGLQIVDLGLIGLGKAGTLLRINSPRGHGGGRYSIRRVVFADATRGITCGDDSYINSADMSFHDCLFRKLETGFYTGSGQNIDYCFIRPHALEVQTVFHLAKGANAYFALPTFVNCRLAFRMDQVGVNCGNLTVAGMHIETAGTEACQVLKANGESVSTFTGLNVQTMRKARESGDTTPLFELTRGAQCVVIGAMIGNGPVGKLTSAENQPPSWLQFISCRFRGPGYLPDPREPKYLETDDRAGFQMRSCLVGKAMVLEHTRMPSTTQEGLPKDDNAPDKTTEETSDDVDEEAEEK